MPRKHTLTGRRERLRKRARNEQKRIRDAELQCRNIRVGHFSQDATSIHFVPVIKAEILDPSEQNQEFILPDYPQDVNSIDPIWVVKTEIQDSSKTNEHLLPNINVEQVEIDNALDKPPKTEDLSERFINSEIDNSLNFEYKLTECSVLLHDCLIPKNLNSLFTKFKSLIINTGISEEGIQKFSDAPFFSHISEAYKNMALSSLSRYQKPTHIYPYITKRKSKERVEKKYVCSCFKASTSSQFYENDSESTQLCLCLASDNKLVESTDILVKKASLFDPDFGKITCGLKIK